MCFYIEKCPYFVFYNVPRGTLSRFILISDLKVYKDPSEGLDLCGFAQVFSTPLSEISIKERNDLMAKTLQELIGKTVLVGITHVTKSGEVLGHSQYFGKVLSADYDRGVLVARSGIKDVVALPPAPNVFLPAKPGVYTLRSSGFKVKDPDYTCTWRLTASDGKK